MANEEDRVNIPAEPSRLFDKIKSLEKENKVLKAESRALKKINSKLEKEVYRSGDWE